MTFGAPLKYLSRHCRTQSASASHRNRERPTAIQPERRSVKAHDVRLVNGSKSTVSRIDPKRQTRLRAVQQPPLVGSNRGMTMHLDVEYVQLLGLHVGESISENKVLLAFDNLSAAKIEDGYSARAMAGRQQLLEEAKEIALKSVGKKISNDKKHGLDLPAHLIPGVLSILTQVEEHDLVMQVGNQMLESKEVANMRRDVLLSMALAKLGQAEYFFSVPNQVAMACTCMDAALQLLTEGGSPPLAPTLCKEIEDALETYVPQCVLDQLKLPLNADNTKGRKDAVSILQGLLTVPRPSDYSFIGVDRHYVKQVMDCLTSCEILQIIDWTTVLTDPKCVKWYYPGLLLKGATVHIVVGFLQRRPALLKSIDTILSIPGKDREAHVEHVVCKLLLGEVDNAFKILDKIEGVGKLEGASVTERRLDGEGPPMPLLSASGDHNAVGAKVLPGRNETLAFVRAHSEPGAADDLQGLCVFCQRWLQNAAYAQFRDTAVGRPTTSLNDYFQDRKVQNMLNASPGTRLFDLINPNKKEENKMQNHSKINENGSPANAQGAKSESDGVYQLQRSVLPGGWQLKQPRALSMAMLSGALLGGLVFASIRHPWMPGTKNFIVTAAAKATIEPTQEEQKEKRMKTAIEIETKRKRRPVLPLRKADAEKLIQKWQFAKSEALGPGHEYKYMRRVLADPMLQTWTANIKEVAERGWFWAYKLDHCRVTHIDASHLHDINGYVDVSATLKESAIMYGRDGKEIDRYKSRYDVTYHVIMDGDSRWKINYIKVLPQHT